MGNLLIIGAGAEKTEGIDMPLANELVPQIRDFINNEEIGRKVDKELRNILKGLRFYYDDFVKKAVDKLASQFKSEVNQILKDIKEVQENETLVERDRKIAKIVVALLKKIQNLQNDVILDDSTAALIMDVFDDIQIGDENIVDLGKLSFTDSFEIVMRRILEISITEPANPVLKHVYRNLMDFENLLLKHFIGFYNNSASDIRNYLYISWTLWAYLVWKEQQVYKSNSNLPFYSVINKSIKVITFNYTSFADEHFNKVYYFHGSLKKYIRLDNRGECEIDDFKNLKIDEFISEILAPNIDFTRDVFVIPSIIPPLKLKPVLSNEFIDIWYNSVELIRNSEKIVIVGYSFNYADEHFNDLIRKNRDKDIYIIDPYIDNIVFNLKRIFNYRKEDYTKIKIQGNDALKMDKLYLIKAKANEVNIDELFGITNV